MDATGLSPTPKINRWLPYLAVFEFDVRYTMRSWVYRVWLLVSFLAAIGYLLYRFGVYHEAGIVQPASLLISDLLRWSVLGSIALIAVLAGSAISSERGTMADSVLSRGISRYQYFFGKLHARLVVVVGTFACMSLITLAGGYFLLHEDLSFGGSAIALLTILSLLAAVAICGVSFSAIFNSTMLGVAILWFVLYGTGVLLSFLPEQYPSPGQLLNNLQQILRGYYDWRSLSRLILWALGSSSLVALFGSFYFARRDV